METVLFLLAILSIFLTFWFGGVTLVQSTRWVLGRADEFNPLHVAVTGIPVTYLIYFFLMRGGN